MSSNVYRDTTLEPSKARHLQAVWDDRVRALARKTPAFDEYQIQALYLIFHKLCEAHEWWGSGLGKDRTDRMDRVGFRDACSALLDIQDGAALDALFSALDPNNKRYLTAARWVKGLAALKGSDLDKAQLCWRAYTKEETPVLTRSDMSSRTKAMFMDVGVDDFDGFCKEFVDTMLKGTKAGKEGVLPLPEYLDIVSKRPLLTELVQTVLPDAGALDAFLATFTPPPRQPRRRRTTAGPSTTSGSTAHSRPPRSPPTDL
ncbi:uncharacterized protein LOC113215952 [Frankliniella occidentalis]|uniref:Uncharacterized protein LOC113215952 n=1 Tax=Frankliniella occidentalis TaxID=133901 RepID=A0A6J1TDQ7_FRAOC|nr:uncharacterized protein LOC113215952 [Frankliniella occidentalis]